MFSLPSAAEGEDLFPKFSASTSVKFLTDAVLLRHGRTSSFSAWLDPQSFHLQAGWFSSSAMDPDSHLWAISSRLLIMGQILELVSKVP